MEVCGTARSLVYAGVGPKHRVNAEFAHLVDENDKVMTENFAERLVDHSNVGLAPQAVAKLAGVPHPFRALCEKGGIRHPPRAWRFPSLTPCLFRHIFLVPPSQTQNRNS